MSELKEWATSSDGSIQYVSITRDLLDETIEVMRNSFYVDEQVSIAVELDKNPKARAELDDLTYTVVCDGLSLAAIDKVSGKIIGVALNKLHTQNSNFTTYLEKLSISSNEPSSKALLQFMIDVDEACDLFKLSNTNCILEIMFLTVIPQYRGRKIARKLFEVAIEMVKLAKSGINCKIPIKDDISQVEPIPEAVLAIFTSPITKRYGREFNFTIAKEISYKEFSYDGKSYFERLGDKNPTTTIEYLVV